MNTGELQDELLKKDNSYNRKNLLGAELEKNLIRNLIREELNHIEYDTLCKIYNKVKKINEGL